ncbi:MAG: DUF1015 family protein [Acidimicrobiia bacterium]|nr:DUF1015 family protein [Acidimicrobiia bacterium]
MKTLPLSGMVVAPDWADAIIAPAYDALDESGRRRHLDQHPHSFLGALPLGKPDTAALESCARRIAEYRHNGQFLAPKGPFAALTRISEEGISITGLVLDVPIGEFESTILGHEKTRAERVGDLADFLRLVGIASSPVTVAHEPNPLTDALAERFLPTPPYLESAADGASVTVWLLQPDDAISAMDAVEAGIIVDGHHRTAAAHAAGSPSVLCAFVPADSLGSTGFDRVAHTVTTDVPSRITATGLKVDALNQPGRPTSSGRVHLFWDGKWFSISGWEEGTIDAAVIDEKILGTALGISDFEVRPAIGPVPTAPLVITSHPPSWETLERMVRAGDTMPPKSTYFTPKMRSGVFLIDR